jgi:hypothetical protein
MGENCLKDTRPRPWLAILLTFSLLAALPMACTPPSPSPEATTPPTAATTAGVPATVAPLHTPDLPRPTDVADYVPTIQQFLNAGGDMAALEHLLSSWDALPGWPDQVVAKDLTGDGAQEIIVALQYAGDSAPPPGDLLILDAGSHALLFQEGYDPHGASIRLLQVIDADRDAKPDIAYTLTTCGAHTCFESLNILKWSGARFSSLMGGRLDMPYPTYSVTTGRIHAQSGLVGSVGAEPQRGYSEVWELQSGVFTVTQQIWQPPVYRYHALLDADRALLAGEYVAAVSGYERVLDDNALQEWGEVSGDVDPATERAYLAAFARWRLALTYLQAGDSGNAQAQHNRLLVDFPGGSVGHDVVSLAEVFWAAYLPSTDIVAGCNRMVAAAKAAPSVHGFFNETYGYANPRWEAVDVCPLGE